MPLAVVVVDGREVSRIQRGRVQIVPLEAGRRCRLRVEPLEKAVNVGAGPGRVWEREIEAGCAGLILDGRSRPLDPLISGGAKYQLELFKSLGLA